MAPIVEIVMDEFAAIVLAGGNARRMAGVDKLAAEIAGISLLDRAIEAAALARATVVVGLQRETVRQVRWTREDPPGGGPVAGIAAGLAAIEAGASATGSSPPWVLLLAGDMPFAGAGVEQLLAAASRLADPIDLIMGVDVAGIDQPLLALWRLSTLRIVIDGLATVANQSVRRLVTDLQVERVVIDDRSTLDCDEPADIETARELLAHESG